MTKSMYDQLNKVTPSTVSSQLLASGDPSGTWASAKGHAVWIRPSSPLIGKTIDSLTWTLKNANGTTGTLDFGVWGTYGNTTPVQSFGSISESTLTTSFADYTLTFTPYTIQEGDYIGFRTSSDGINSMVTASASLPSLYTDYHASTWWNNGLSGAYGWDTYPNTGGGNLSSSTNTHSVAFGIQGRLMGQRFVENFSGSVLDTDRWLLEQAIGTGNTGAMVDSVDGGYAITPAGVLDGGAITFNDKRQYSYNSSVCIAVCNKIDVDGRYRVGLSEDETLATTYNDTAHCFDGASGNIYLQTANGTAGNDTASNVTANTTTVHGIKIETKSSSVELSIDGVLKVTNTTYLPLTKLQPVFLARGGGGSGNQKSAIRYMECYNT
tara:strand:- start:86 stop:1228 length:1143 start_codon:yes stop_codon:yes gene_type:complete